MDNLPDTVSIVNDVADGFLVFTAQMLDANALDVLTASIINIAPATTNFVIEADSGKCR